MPEHNQTPQGICPKCDNRGYYGAVPDFPGDTEPTTVTVCKCPIGQARLAELRASPTPAPITQEQWAEATRDPQAQALLRAIDGEQKRRPTCGTGKATQTPALSPLAQALLMAAEQKDVGRLGEYTIAAIGGHLRLSVDVYDAVRAVAQLLAHTAAEAKREEKERLHYRVTAIIDRAKHECVGLPPSWGSPLYKLPDETEVATLGRVRLAVSEVFLEGSDTDG